MDFVHTDCFGPGMLPGRELVWIALFLLPAVLLFARRAVKPPPRPGWTLRSRRRD